MHDITRLRQIVEDTEIRLDGNDAISITLWATWLQQDGARVILKDKSDPPPPGSGISPDTFVLCMQTTFQSDRFQELSSDSMSIDATHNTTQYIGLQLFTIMVRDMWGHGACTLWHISGMDTAYSIFVPYRGTCHVDAVVRWNSGNNSIFPYIRKITQSTNCPCNCDD